MAQNFLHGLPHPPHNLNDLLPHLLSCDLLQDLLQDLLHYLLHNLLHNLPPHLLNSFLRCHESKAWALMKKTEEPKARAPAREPKAWVVENPKARRDPKARASTREDEAPADS